MAHKTLINGTAYGIDGGKTLVSGTSYKVTNGKVLIGGTAYDISFLLPPSALDVWSGKYYSNNIKCITYANGYWVLGGEYYDGNTSYARIAYATSLNGTWKTLDLWSASIKAEVNGIAYGNGYWLAGGLRKTGSASYAHKAYATSFTGTWTGSDSWGNSNSYNTISSVIYANGYFAMGGCYYSSSTYYARISYATSPSGTWTAKNLWSSSGRNNAIYDIAYANGYWVACGSGYSSYIYYARIAYTNSSNPTGTWTSKNMWGHTADDLYSIYGITYANGYWVVSGRSYNSNTNSYSGVISYATSISGSWTMKVLWTSTMPGGRINSVTFADGYFVVGGIRYNSGYRACIAYTTNPSGTWTITDLWGGSSYDSVYSVSYCNGYFMAGGQYYANKAAHLSYAGSPVDFITE